MRILGLVGATHDSGIALIENGVPLHVIEEERLNREKRTKAFPRNALQAVLGEQLEGMDGIDALVTPWHMGRLRRSFLGAVLRRFPLSLGLIPESAHTPQRSEIVLLNQLLRRKLGRVSGRRRVPGIINVPHHDAHAAFFFASPFEEASILVMDGFGDDASTSVYYGRGNRIERRWHTSLFNSLGIVYTFVTEYLGFGGFSDEGKVMALAAYGDTSLVTRFRDVIKLEPEGRYRVDMSYFSFDKFGELRPFTSKFVKAFGPPRAPGAPLDDRHKALARALQEVTEEVIMHMAREMARTTPSRNIVVVGGVALNCVANAKILEQTPFERIWVPPNASDTGAPLGAAFWHYHATLGHPRGFELKHHYYGLTYSDEEIRGALAGAGLKWRAMTEAELMERVARDLADGNTVGWFQGAFEMGPRALGNRSILADPRRAEMKDLINATIKHRESFRPFAPAVLAERAHEFFEIDQQDPFMTLAPRIREDKKHVIPAAVHVDGTGRIQTIERSANPRYYGIIEAFGKLTGVPVLLNTSFNRQEPIVASPEEAISCFLRTGMDVLVLGNHYVDQRGSASPRAKREAAAGAGAP